MGRPPPHSLHEGGRGWAEKAENVERRGAASGCSIHDECRAHVHAHTRVLHDMCYRRSGKRRKGLTRRTTGIPFFLYGIERRIAPGSVAKSAPKLGWPAPGKHSELPARALPTPTLRRHSRTTGISQMAKLFSSVRRTMNGKLHDRRQSSRGRRRI